MKVKLMYKRNKEGITLIALVVTIVVLLILSGVTIVTLFGENGIITAAQKAAKNTKDSVKQDEDKIKKLIEDMESYFKESPKTVATLYEKGTENIKEYQSIEEALKNSYDGANIMIVNDAELKENITIPAGVSIINNQYTIDMKEHTMNVEGTLQLDIKINSSDGKAHKKSDVSIGKVKGTPTTSGAGVINDESLITKAEIQTEDYINYPYQYENVLTTDPTDSTQTATSTFNGWRVIVNMQIPENNEDISEEQLNFLEVRKGQKIIRIITAGIPENVNITIEKLMESEIKAIEGADLDNNPATFYQFKALDEFGKKYYVSKYSESYSIMKGLDLMSLQAEDKCDSDLAVCGGYYVINHAEQAENETDIGICGGTPEGIGGVANQNLLPSTIGIRPTITLKNDLHVVKIWDDKNESYYWEFMD